MGRSRWKQLPPDLPSPVRELAERLRALLDDHGLSLRQLAAADDVHYSVTTLHRYFSGQALPPRQLLEVVSRRCGGDLAQLDRLHERARAHDGAPPATETDPPAEVRGAGRRRRWIPVVAIVIAGVVAALVITADLIADTPAPAGPTGYELIVNGGFDSVDDEGFTKWWVHDARTRPEGGTARIDVTGGTVERWDVLFGQSGLRITAGKDYTLRFTASAERVVTMGVAVQEERPPDYSTVYVKNVALGPGQSVPQTLHFVAEQDTTVGQLVFQFGGHAEDFTVFLDDVSLFEHAD